MMHLMLATNFFLILSPRVEKCSGIFCFLKILMGFFYCLCKCLHFFSGRWQWQTLCLEYKLLWFVTQQSLQKQPTAPCCAEQHYLRVVCMLYFVSDQNQLKDKCNDTGWRCKISLSHEYLRQNFSKISAQAGELTAAKDENNHSLNHFLTHLQNSAL